jgi:hypothetical protein
MQLSEAARVVAALAFDQLEGAARDWLIDRSRKDPRERLLAKVEYGDQLCIAADTTGFY